MEQKEKLAKQGKMLKRSIGSNYKKGLNPMANKTYKYINNIPRDSKVPPTEGEISLTLEPLEPIEGITLYKSKWQLDDGKRIKLETVYYLNSATLLLLCTLDIWNKNINKFKVTTFRDFVERHTNFEIWRAKNPIKKSEYQRMIDFANEHGYEFKAIFQQPFQRFVHPMFGFDLCRFDEVINPPEGISLKDHIKSKYGDRASELISSLI